MTSLVKVTSEKSSLDSIKADILIVPVSELKDLKSDELKVVRKATNIKDLSKEDFEAKPGQTLLFRGLKDLETSRLLFVGLGEKNEEIRASVVKAARKARSTKSPRVALFIPDKSLTKEIVEGFLLGAYAFDKYKSSNKEDDEKAFRGFEELVVFGNVCEKGLDEAQVFAKGIYKARDLGNESPNHLFPETLAEEAVKIAENYGLKHTIYDEKYLTENGFNLLMAVGKGSAHQPRLIHLEYHPEGEVKRTIALVGKGITFDTGGYDLKTGGHILNMHLDMCGGAAVLGAAEIIGQLKPKHIAIHFIVPAAENFISSSAYLPNDIIRGLGGKTVEIQNTDAEGRLVLADALTYAQRQNVDEIIDLATLTGACVVALGEKTAALYSDDESMVKDLLKAAKNNEEDLWRMPLTKKLDKELDSKVADMRNIGNRWGGSITAALFLKRWVDIDAWAHIDLAGPAMANSETELSSPGGTGYAVALLADYILRKSKKA